MRRAWVFAVLLAVGCASTSDPKIVGRWNQKIRTVEKTYGVEAGADEVGERINEQQQFHYEFRDDGTYVYRVGTTEFPGSWSSSGDTVTLNNGTELELSMDGQFLYGLDRGGNEIALTKAP